MFKLNCVIKDAGVTMNVTEKFSKREFVVTVPDEKYPQVVQFQLVNDRTSLLDGFKNGDNIEVSFSLRGREWTNPTSGEVRVFNTLDAFRVERVGSSPAPAPKAAPATQTATADEDDLPF